MTALDDMREAVAAPDLLETNLARRERTRQLLRSPAFLVGVVFVGTWVICALAGGLIAPYDPQAADVLRRLESPSSAHLMGTDRLGRDVLSRLIVGAREVLVTAPAATIVAVTLGTTLGLVAGYFRGVVDEAIMRVLDALAAIPLIIMALLAVVALGPSRPTLIVVIGIVFLPVVTRTVRAAVVTERELDYLDAAKLRNESTRHILLMELLPNVLGVVIVEFTVRLGYAIFTIAALSFLGFGADPSVPDWGQDIASNYQFINGGSWWPVLFPALAIATLIVGINLIADAVSRSFER